MDRVVFACRHNAGRSQMAAAFFNLATDPSRARAISAGTEPARQVHPEVAAAMKEVGIDLAGAQPQKLTTEVAAGARYLITMGCGESCPVLPGLKVEDWELEDPKGQSLARVREIRDEIRGRVEELVRNHGWGRSSPS
jgi:arsenate reductase (thioredoxin)